MPRCNELGKIIVAYSLVCWLFQNVSKLSGEFTKDQAIRVLKQLRAQRMESDSTL